jgi:hypothetical protein
MIYTSNIDLKILLGDTSFKTIGNSPRIKSWLPIKDKDVS